MADIIQFRRDTAERWAEFNPTLAEGEIGFVLGTANHYKVGDGVHAWNDLPVKGFNGNIEDELGERYESVISQGGLTDILKGIISNGTHIDISDGWNVLDEQGKDEVTALQSVGLYVLMNGSHPIYHMLVTSDNITHGITQWIFGNLFIENDGQIRGAHNDEAARILFRSIHWSDSVPSANRGTWTKWQYLQDGFISNDGNIKQNLPEESMSPSLKYFKETVTNLRTTLNSKEQLLRQDYTGKIEETNRNLSTLQQKHDNLVSRVDDVEDTVNFSVEQAQEAIGSLQEGLSEAQNEIGELSQLLVDYEDDAALKLSEAEMRLGKRIDGVGILPFNTIVEAHHAVIDGAPSYDVQFPSFVDGSYRHIIFDKSRRTFLWEIHAGDYPDCPAGDAYTSWNGSEEYVSEGHPRTDRLYRLANELYRWDGTTLRSYSAAIAAKQDALTTSDDLMISQDNELSLTDKAKYATFDAQWTAIGGTVVESGKTYSINGGTGDFADAVKAMTYYTEQPRADLSWLCFGKSLKLLPTIIVPNTARVNFSLAFASLYGINKVVIRSTYTDGVILVGDMFAVFNSSQVKELDCVLDVSAANNLSTAFPYSKIEEIRLKRLNDNISFPHSKNLSLASLQYLVENATNTKAITLTVHADVFAKLTDESNTDWHAVAVAALAKNITIAST